MQIRVLHVFLVYLPLYFSLFRGSRMRPAVYTTPGEPAENHGKFPIISRDLFTRPETDSDNEREGTALYNVPW